MTLPAPPSQLPPGYTLRPPQDADVAAAAALYRARDLALYGESDATEAEVVEDWSLPRLDLESDVWLVDAPDGGLAGCGQFWLENPPGEAVTWQLVHPAHRGRGITGALLALGETRARAAAADGSQTLSLGTFTDAGDAAHLDVFARHGFAPAREFLRMEVTFAVPPLPAPPPPGITIRGFRRGRDEAAVHAAVQEAFLDHFRPSLMGLAEWTAFRFGRPDLDLGLWLIAWDGAQVAGSVLSFVLPTGGYVEELCVRRPWRGRGLGRALLLLSFAGLHQRGARRAVLGVDSANPTGAVRLYESVGMAPTRHQVFWAKDFRP